MDQTEHENQWRYNEILVRWLTSNGIEINDWIITILFYTCLHKIDILLHKKGIKNTQLESHGDRDFYVKTKLRFLYTSYNQIYRKCRQVRYQQDKLNEITDTMVQNYRNIWFKEIKPVE